MSELGTFCVTLSHHQFLKFIWEMKNLLWCWRGQLNSAVASSMPWWNTVVGGAQDQNVGEEELDQRYGFESECSSDSFSLSESSKAWLTALHSLCSAAASVQLCLLQIRVLETSSTVWAPVSAYRLYLQDRGLVLYGGFLLVVKNVLFVEPPVGIKQSALRGKKSRTKLHTKLGLLVSMIFTISVETAKSFSSWSRLCKYCLQKIVVLFIIFSIPTV